MQIYEVLQFHTKKMEKQKGVRDKVMRERERERRVELLLPQNRKEQSYRQH